MDEEENQKLEAGSSENSVSSAGTVSQLESPFSESLTPSLSLSLKDKTFDNKKIKGFHLHRQTTIEGNKKTIDESVYIDEISEMTKEEKLFNLKKESAEVIIEKIKNQNKIIKNICNQFPAIEKILTKIFSILKSSYGN